MRWLHAEYILKGTYLGLLLFAALAEPDWISLGVVALLALGGLAIALGVAAFQKMRAGYRAAGKFLPFLAFLILESPILVYAGIVGGMAAGAAFLCKDLTDVRLLAILAMAGAALGIVFWLLRTVRQRWYRVGLSLLLATGLAAAALFFLGKLGEFGGPTNWKQPADTVLFGAQLLLGMPLFYLLTFAGREEETEVEIGVICATLGIGAAILTRPVSPVQSPWLLWALLLYVLYTTRILPKLRVFKHALRGYSYAQIGRHRQAILSFRRALQFDPQNALAREGLWGVHRAIDLSQLANDPAMMGVVDLDMCLERASSLLLNPGPAPEKIEEAQRLLSLVLSQRPNLRATVYYWRAVAHTHARQYDEAASDLQQVLDPGTYTPDDPERQAILLQAWQLALKAKPELAQRVGNPELALPGRRMEAIAAVERCLAGDPENAELWGFKRVLYQDLSESDYNSAAGEGAANNFDHGYTYQLGLALIEDNTRWQRGAEYLRLAARGLPGQAPSIYTLIAQAHDRAKDGSGAWRYYERARDAGRAVGPKSLAAEERQAYFTAVKVLADAALKHDLIDKAIENYHLYTEYERCGLETLRTLADLYERKGDAYALRITEQALLYDSKDKDLLARKERYYYSMPPEYLRIHLESCRSWFDVDYCVKKAKALLDSKNWDLDTLDWAQHLIELTRIVKPQSQAVKVLLARVFLRRGEKDKALPLLEEVHTPRPQKFASGDDEDAWYLGSKLLGELYLYDFNKPDLAVDCFRSFRESTRSGADTLYKLGQAYEALGDRVRASKYYKQVTGFSDHPLASDAYDALHRMEAQGST